jgi:hypothetical protein
MKKIILPRFKSAIQQAEKTIPIGMASGKTLQIRLMPTKTDLNGPRLMKD